MTATLCSDVIFHFGLPPSFSALFNLKPSPKECLFLICKTVNLERNFPLASEASVRLSQEIRLAKCSRCRALKVIHGYGSSGKGGAIKAACLKLCAERKRSGMIRHFVKLLLWQSIAICHFSFGLTDCFIRNRPVITRNTLFRCNARKNIAQIYINIGSKSASPLCLHISFRF